MPDPENNSDLCVETTDAPSTGEIESTNDKELCVETRKFAIKECSVKLKSLESILFPKRRSGRKNKNTTQSKPTPVLPQVNKDRPDTTEAKPILPVNDVVPAAKGPPQAD